MTQKMERFGCLEGFDSQSEEEIAVILAKHQISRFDEYVCITTPSCIQLDGNFTVTELRAIIELAETLT